MARGRTWRKRGKAALPARGAYRLPARGDRRGARLGGRAARHRDVRVDRRARVLARAPGKRASAALCRAQRTGYRHLDRLSGFRQHGREHGAAAYQGADAAAHELRRLGAGGELRRARHPAAHRLGKPPAGKRAARVNRTMLILAGGTGGHIFPGLGVAQEARAAGWQVVWMGARGGMEERLVPRHGIPAKWIRARAARGRGLLQKLFLPANLLYSFWESARHIRNIRPDVVLGLGGYVAFPGGMMASLLGRPLALHEQYARAGVHGELLGFIDDMARRYAEADLVICRAGAVTIAELSAAGMASILVPFPYAVDDHQTANARFLADRGAAILVPQHELNPQKLAQLLASLDRPKLADMAIKARALGKPDAAKIVAQRCMELAK